jgi:hypothetical protein
MDAPAPAKADDDVRSAQTAEMLRNRCLWEPKRFLYFRY